jgi:hypothetical protein
MKRLVKASTQAKNRRVVTAGQYFAVEQDTSYVQENPDYASAVYKYYLSNPNGDGDGFVEVNEFDDGTFEIEGLVDHPSIRNGTLSAVDREIAVSTEPFNSQADLESYIDILFRTYMAWNDETIHVFNSPERYRHGTFGKGFTAA